MGKREKEALRARNQLTGRSFLGLVIYVALIVDSYRVGGWRGDLLTATISFLGGITAYFLGRAWGAVHRWIAAARELDAMDAELEQRMKHRQQLRDGGK